MADDPLMPSGSWAGWGEENGPFNLALEFEDPSNPGLMPSSVLLTTNPYSWNTVRCSSRPKNVICTCPTAV